MEANRQDEINMRIRYKNKINELKKKHDQELNEVC